MAVEVEFASVIDSVTVDMVLTDGRGGKGGNVGNGLESMVGIGCDRLSLSTNALSVFDLSPSKVISSDPNDGCSNSNIVDTLAPKNLNRELPTIRVSPKEILISN